MTDETDKSFFQFVNETFTAPALFFLAIVLFAATGYAIWTAPQHTSYIVAGWLMFILGYNAFRIGNKLR